MRERRHVQRGRKRIYQRILGDEQMPGSSWAVQPGRTEVVLAYGKTVSRQSWVYWRRKLCSVGRGGRGHEAPLEWEREVGEEGSGRALEQGRRQRRGDGTEAEVVEDEGGRGSPGRRSGKDQGGRRRSEDPLLPPGRFQQAPVSTWRQRVLRLISAAAADGQMSAPPPV